MAFDALSKEFRLTEKGLYKSTGGHIRCAYSQPLALLEAHGHFDRSLARQHIAWVDDLLDNHFTRPAHVFADWSAMTGFEPLSQTTLTQHVIRQRKKLASVDIVAHSALVSLGIRVANMGLGKFMTLHDNLESFQDAFRRCAQQVAQTS